MGWEQDARDWFNNGGRSISDSFNQLKDDFINFLNTTAKDASNDANKQIANYSNSIQMSARGALTNIYDQTNTKINTINSY